MIEKVTRYKTMDGQLFGTIEEANVHEQQLLQKQEYNKQPLYGRSFGEITYEELATWAREAGWYITYVGAGDEKVETASLEREGEKR